ncbi:chromosome segregation protein SMC, partial [Pseudomonas sp. F1002]|nr:chromosome segregation protein SMC [Pseudomonas sp. F1002]
EELAEQLQRQQAIEKEQDRQQHRQQQLETLHKQLAEQSALQHAAKEKLAGLLGENSSAEHWQQQLDLAVDQARQHEAEANQQLQDTRNQLIQLAADLKSLQERQQSLETEHAALTTRLSDWRALHPELDDEGLARLVAFDE